jgi:hypothetical protein
MSFIQLAALSFANHVVVVLHWAPRGVQPRQPAMVPRDCSNVAGELQILSVSVLCGNNKWRTRVENHGLGFVCMVTCAACSHVTSLVFLVL